MDKGFIREQKFEKIYFVANPLAKGEYECCTFTNCNFSDADLSGFKFLECEFINCNLSLARLQSTSLGDIKFNDCKMLGLRFDNCHPFGFSVNFNNCALDHSSFYQTKLKKTVFKNVRLYEVDFTECDLTGAVFDDCDLTRATFENTILEKADFQNAANYSIDPALNRMKKAKFSLSGIPGLLDKYDIEIN